MFMRIDRGIYEELSEAGKGVIQFLNQNEEKIPYVSITNIAKKAFTSQSMVSRAIQKCGYQGTSQLRYTISQQEWMKEHHESSYGVSNILAKSHRESIETIDSIGPVAMLKTTEYVKQTKRIFIFARGFTALIAKGFRMCLQLLGYNAIIIRDVKWMENTERIVTKGDIAFILFLRDSTPELARSARATRMEGAEVTICYCKSPCKLGKFSDIIIYGHFEQIMEASGMTVCSGIPLLIVTRTIIEYIRQQSS